MPNPIELAKTFVAYSAIEKAQFFAAINPEIKSFPPDKSGAIVADMVVAIADNLEAGQFIAALHYTAQDAAELLPALGLKPEHFLTKGGNQC